MDGISPGIMQQIKTTGQDAEPVQNNTAADWPYKNTPEFLFDLADSIRKMNDEFIPLELPYL